MRQTQFKRVMILSAEREQYSYLDNRARTNNLTHCLNDLDIQAYSALGYYNNSLEHSLVVLPKSREEFDAVLDLAFKNFEQDSVLYQGTNGESCLYTKEGSKIRIGKLRETSKVEAYANGDYTLFNNRYYSIKG